MPQETKPLINGTQYDDFKGKVAIDEPVGDTTDRPAIYQAPDGKRNIGWKISKHAEQSSVRVKILSVDEGDYDPNNGLQPGINIYVEEVNISVDDFINQLRRIDMTVMRKNFENSFGETFTFIDIE